MRNNKNNNPLRQKLLLMLGVTITFLVIIEGICTILYNSELDPIPLSSDDGGSKVAHIRDFDLGFINKPNVSYEAYIQFRTARVHPNPIGMLAIAEDLADVIP